MWLKNKNLPYIFICCLFIACNAKGDEENNEIKIIGHGGAGFETYFNQLPANTIASFEKALRDENAEGIEMDVQLSKDNVVVVFHDKILENKTDCSGSIREHPFSELETCDFYGDFKLFSKGKHNISSLEQVFATFKDQLQKKDYYVNIKMGVDPDGLNYSNIMSKQLVNIIQKFSIHKNVIIESSDVHILKLIRDLDSNVIVMLDIGLFEDFYHSVVEHELHGLVVQNKNITSEQVSKAQSDGKKVVIYGVKTRSAIKESLKMKPDAIQTDKVGLAKRLNN